MFKKLQSILSMDLLKVFSFTGLSTLVKILTSFVSVKVISSIIGPSGVALIGQLQNFVSILTTFGSLGINNGVVKYVSEYSDQPSALHGFLSNGFKITVIVSLILGLVTVLSAGLLSRVIFLDAQYYYVFIFFGISLLFISLNNFLLSILNGFKNYQKYVWVNIVTSIVGLAFSVVLVLAYGIKGALIGNVTFQAIILFVTLFMIRKVAWLRWEQFNGRINREILQKFLQYSLMALVSVITVPVSQLIIRGYLIQEYSIEQAGFWEGMNRISGLYLMFVTTSFSVYYLPRLAEIRSKALLRKEINSAYKLITPIIFVSLCIMYFVKDWVIYLVFSKEFYPMKELFLWQLIGDFFKILSWILAFIMVARSLTRIFVITEVLFSLLLIGLSYIFIDKNGTIGATQAYCINYFLYFVAMLCVFRKLLFKKLKR